MWFDNISEAAKPGRDELTRFTSGVEALLGFLFDNPDDFAFLWENDKDLLPLGKQTYEQDVRNSLARMRDVIPKAEESRLIAHGLLGLPLRFKLKALESIDRLWEAAKDQFKIREWLKRVFEMIDAILDSLIEALGVGGLTKEFKDTLSALG